MKTHPFFDNDQGMQLQQNTLARNKQQADWIENLHLNAAGRWSNADIGYQTLNANAPLAGGQPVLSLHHFTDVAGTEHTVAQAGNNLYAVNLTNGAATLLYAGLSATGRLRSVAFLGWLFLVGTNQPPLRWDGQNAPQLLPNWPPVISGMAAVGTPSLAACYANRLIVAGDESNPSALYLSALEAPTDFTLGSGAATAGVIQVQPGDGDRVTALHPFFLPVVNQQVLLIFKQRSVFMLTGWNATDFTLQKLTGERGAVGQESVVALGQDVLFLTPELQIARLATTAMQGNLSFGLVSTPIAQQLAQANRNALANTLAVLLPQRNELWWFLPEGSATHPNRVLVARLLADNQVVWSVRSGIQATAVLHSPWGLVTGQSTGTLQRQLTGSVYDTAPVPWVYRTPYYPLGNPLQRKRLREVVFYLHQASRQGFTVATRWDLYPRIAASLVVREQAIRFDANLIFGTALWGAGHYSDRGASTAQVQLPGSGKLLQLELTGQTPEQPIELEGWTITTLEGGMR